VLVQMCAAVATGASTPEAAAAEAETALQRYFRRQGGKNVIARSEADEAIHSFFGDMDCFRFAKASADKSLSPAMTASHRLASGSY